MGSAFRPTQFSESQIFSLIQHGSTSSRLPHQTLPHQFGRGHGSAHWAMCSLMVFSVSPRQDMWPYHCCSPCCKVPQRTDKGKASLDLRTGKCSFRDVDGTCQVQKFKLCTLLKCGFSAMCILVKNDMKRLFASPG